MTVANPAGRSLPEESVAELGDARLIVQYTRLRGDRVWDWLEVSDADGNNRAMSPPGPRKVDRVIYFVWSPDGARVAYAAGGYQR